MTEYIHDTDVFRLMALGEYSALYPYLAKSLLSLEQSSCDLNTWYNIVRLTNSANALKIVTVIRSNFGSSVYQQSNCSMADAVQCKRQRLAHLERFRRRVPYVSQSALSAVLQEAKTSGIPDLSNRKYISEARNAALDMSTPYGKLQQSIDATPRPPHARQQLQVVHPLALLHVLLATCVAFSDFVERTHDANPSSADKPWNLCLYSDEVTPGNQLLIDNKRKIQAVYFSFMEFGPSLASEDLWMTITAKRSHVVSKNICGGMSQVFGIILKLFFVTHSLHDVGCTFRFASGRMVRIFAKVQVFLQDGGAHKLTWHCKGDGGAKFCLLCHNVFSIKSELASVDDDGDFCSDIIKVNELDLATSDDLTVAIRRIHHYRSIDTVGMFEKRQIALGFTYSGYNLMCDPELDDVLDPANQFMHDWMHCLFVSGVFNITLNLVLRALHFAGVTDAYSLAYSFIERWRWPQRLRQRALHEMFAQPRERANNEARKFKCSASEAWSLYNVIRFFFTLFPALCVLEIKAYISLCLLIDCFTCVLRGKVTPKILLTRTHAFLEAFGAAFGLELMTPKFHWLLHFPMYLRRFGTLVSCFVHERKHRMVKRYCNDMRNTSTFEWSVLAEVMQRSGKINLVDVIFFENVFVVGSF